MNTAIAIVAHTKRAEQAHQLMETVGAQYMAMDNGTYGCNNNHIRCWQYLAKQPTQWGLTLEDDAIVEDHFTEQIHQALANTPAPVVSLYLGTSRPVWYQPRRARTAQPLQPLIGQAITTAEQQDASYITSRLLFHAVAVAIRTDLIASMLEHTATSRRPIDFAISDWCERHNHAVAYTMPSLCDHRDEPPVTQHPDRQPRNKPRKAWRHGTRTTWTGRTVLLQPSN